LDRLTQLPELQSSEDRENINARLRGRMADLNKIEREQECVETTQGRVCDISAPVAPPEIITPPNRIEQAQPIKGKRFSNVDKLMQKVIKPGRKVIPYRTNRLLKDRSFRKKKDHSDAQRELQSLQERFKKIEQSSAVISNSPENREEVWNRLRARNAELNRLQNDLDAVEQVLPQSGDLNIPQSVQDVQLPPVINPLQCPICKKVFRSSRAYVKKHIANTHNVNPETVLNADLINPEADPANFPNWVDITQEEVPEDRNKRKRSVRQARFNDPYGSRKVLKTKKKLKNKSKSKTKSKDQFENWN